MSPNLLGRDEGEPAHPILQPKNTALHRKYQTLAFNTPRVHFVCRLPSYRSLSIAQGVTHSLTLASKLTGGIFEAFGQPG